MNNRIKEVRESLKNDNGKKYTQTQFAETLHVTRDMIASYESGKVEPTALFISSLCSTFNINEDWLRTGIGEMFNPRDRESEVAELAKRLLKADYDDVIAKIVRNLAMLSFEDWQKLNDIIKKLLEDEKNGSN